MALLDSSLLSLVVFLPLIWALLGLAVPLKGEASSRFWRVWALVGSALVFILSLGILARFDSLEAGFQLREHAEWIRGSGISYRLGVDGISLWLILLTTFLSPLVILGSFGSINKNEKAYYALLLVLETGMLGAFVALDAFLFYVFWEAMLIPMYFLVGIWGGKERVYAATKFLVYTVAGSLLMLVAIFYLAHQYAVQSGGGYSLYLLDLYTVRLSGAGYFSAQSLLFLAFAFAFAIKVPLFPLHTWLPDAHVQAPTAGSVVLAGVLLKMGGYGLIRFALPLFPDAVMLYRVPMMWLAVVAISYGALVAFVQTDIKKLVAYSSVSHMGYVVLGIFSLNIQGMTGAVFQMLAHGISTSGLFFLVGMLYDRRHTREMEAFGGVAKVMPLYAVAFLIIVLSSLALPGTNGFVGEFLVLLGAWMAFPWIAALAGLGVVLGAVYLLWMYQRVMLGPVTCVENEKLTDLTLKERLVLMPLIVAVFAMGLAPNWLIQPMRGSISAVLVPFETTPPAPLVGEVEVERKAKEWN